MWPTTAIRGSIILKRRSSLVGSVERSDRLGTVTLTAICAATIVGAAARVAGGEPPAFVVEKGVRQLFLDDYAIERTDGLRRVVNQPIKHPKNPVLRGEHPWERFRVQVYGTALYDAGAGPAGLFKIWYLAIPRTAAEKVTIGGKRRPGHATLLAYATSTDGVRWAKPELGLVDFEGSKANNLVIPDSANVEGASILFEPHEPDPARRYKAFYWDHGRGPLVKLPDGREIYGEGPDDGIYVAFSPDGIHWTPHPDNPVLGVYSDTGQSVVYDPRIKKYVAFGRFGFGRKQARTESTDFIHWSKPQLVFEADARDGPNTQFYGMGVDIYEGLYVGLLWLYYEGTDHHLDVQLASSRDGVKWQRVGDRQLFIPNGPPGSWDGGDLRTACRPVVLDDRIMIYYAGSRGRHTKGQDRTMSIGLATLRRDGFVSLNGGDEPGTLLTRTFVPPAPQLFVNADANGGEITVAVCDEAGRPLTGLGRSRPITGDTLGMPVAWEGGDFAKHAGGPVRLRFHIRRAKLFSFWFE